MLRIIWSSSGEEYKDKKILGKDYKLKDKKILEDTKQFLNLGNFNL